MKTAKRKGSTTPKLTRQHAFYGKLPDDLGKEKRKSTAKYRWVWMIKNHDEMLWREYAKSVLWFRSYAACKKSALSQDIDVPVCAAVRLYIEVDNNGFVNVLEVQSENDPVVEYHADAEQEDGVARYRWEWKMHRPRMEQWKPYIKSDKWFKSFQECKQDGQDFDFDVECSAGLKLCIQVWHNNECILETYFSEKELRTDVSS